jgi:hypothetical protein
VDPSGFSTKKGISPEIITRDSLGIFRQINNKRRRGNEE